MNRGSSQTGVGCGGRGSPDARAEGLRACDKCSEAGRREEAREGRGKARRAGDEEEEGKAGPAEIGWKTLRNSHARPRILRRHKSRLCRQWSGSSSTTSKNCSKKSIFSTYVRPSPASLVAHTSLQWKQDANLREIKVMRRYHIQDREDYNK